MAAAIDRARCFGSIPCCITKSRRADQAIFRAKLAYGIARVALDVINDIPILQLVER